MTTGRSYPLEMLMTLRKRVKERWEQRLAQDLALLGQVEASQERARQQIEEQSRRIDQHRQKGANPERSSIAELQGHELYRQRLLRAQAMLRRTHQEALQTRDEKRKALGQTRQALAQAEAQLQVVQKNFAAWDRDRRQAEHRRAEEELEELAAAKPSGLVLGEGNGSARQ